MSKVYLFCFLSKSAIFGEENVDILRFGNVEECDAVDGHDEWIIWFWKGEVDEDEWGRICCYLDLKVYDKYLVDGSKWGKQSVIL